jgi:predicted  nucleic acid-binding Zn ribbon protein
MQVFDIVVDLSQSNSHYSDIEDLLWTLLSHLSNSGQIINDDYVFVKRGDSVHVQVVCPESPVSPGSKPFQYVTNAWQKLTDAIGTSIQIVMVGDVPQYADYVVPKPNSYILRYGWFSPLLCADTMEPVPLYTIPATYHDGLSYDDVRSWERNYKRIHGLWMNGEIHESFFLQQMQEVDSELSIIGREVCKTIERLTGKPTYYFLMNYRDWSVTEDVARRCPITGNEWLLPNKTASDPIAFRCEASRLVSELSHNCNL